MPITKIRNEGRFSITSASRPSTAAHGDRFAPDRPAACAAGSGRTGPSPPMRRAASRNWALRCLHPHVADDQSDQRSSRRWRTRGCSGNSLPAFLTLRRVSELVERDGGEVTEGSTPASARRRRRRWWTCATPDREALRPIRCSAASTRSVEKKRSAIRPTKNGEIMQASAVVPNTAPAWSPENFSVTGEVRGRS